MKVMFKVTITVVAAVVIKTVVAMLMVRGHVGAAMMLMAAMAVMVELMAALAVVALVATMAGGGGVGGGYGGGVGGWREKRETSIQWRMKPGVAQLAIAPIFRLWKAWS